MLAALQLAKDEQPMLVAQRLEKGAGAAGVLLKKFDIHGAIRLSGLLIFPSKGDCE
jgi:hypothetical protein